MPQSFEAERLILGAILMDNAALTRVAEVVEPDDFFNKEHKAIYLAMLELQNDGSPVDLHLLTDYMQQKHTLDSITGGAVNLANLMDGMPRITNVEHYGKIVRRKCVQRQLIYASAATLQQALDGEDDLQEILKRAEKSMCQVLEFEKREPVPQLSNGNGHVHFQDYSLADFMAAKFPPKEHLIEALTPRNGRCMIIALPHRLKSYCTTGMALGATIPTLLFGHLKVEKPVRTFLAQLEDWPGELQYRIQNFIVKDQFANCNSANVRILPRCELDLTQEPHFAWLVGRLKEFKPDHVILDVLRKFFSGDVNSPKETAAFLKRLDQLQDIIRCALTLVHHENRKKEELMLAAAGSYNWAGWAEVMIHFSRKTEAKTDDGGTITAVEIEVDTKAGPPVETKRLVLDMNLPHPLRLEALEDGTGFRDAMAQLTGAWNVDHLATALDVNRKSAWKRIQAWRAAGKIEKVSAGKRGRGGGLATFQSLDPIDTL